MRYALCDDNLLILNTLEKILNKIFKKHNIEGEIALTTGNGEKLINYILNNQIDVLFLDINLHSNKNGLELAKEIRKFNKKIYIIFLSGHLEYALLAYKLKTFDFISKPITFEKIEETILRLNEDYISKDFTYININNKNTILNSNEIIYIKKNKMETIFHTKNKNYKSYISLTKLENMLPKEFIRCQKSYIVNTNKIKHINKSSYILTFIDNKTCPIGPNYRKNLIKIINKNEYNK